jgi:hypothetical protein
VLFFKLGELGSDTFGVERLVSCNWNSGDTINLGERVVF